MIIFGQWKASIVYTRYDIGLQFVFNSGNIAYKCACLISTVSYASYHIIKLILSGDIELNPGPGKLTKECPICSYIRKKVCACGHVFCHKEGRPQLQINTAARVKKTRK